MGLANEPVRVFLRDLNEWKLGGIERLGSVCECKPLTYIVATMPARNIGKCLRDGCGSASGRRNGFPYLHGLDEALIDAINMLDHSLGKQIAAQIAHNLMDINNDGAFSIGKEFKGLDARIDLIPL